MLRVIIIFKFKIRYKVVKYKNKMKLIYNKRIKNKIKKTSNNKITSLAKS